MKKVRTLIHRLGTTCGQRSTLRGGRVLCLVHRARSTITIGGAPHGWKTPWAPQIAILFAGERERRALWPSGLRKQIERPQPSRKQVCDRLQSLGWARERRASARRYRPLQPVAPRAHDRRCPSQADRDNARLAWSLVDQRELAAPVRREPIWSCSDEARLACLRKERRATRIATDDGPTG